MQEFKAREKIVQKMTRAGAVEVSKTTGDAERISSRETDAPGAEREPNNGAGRLADRTKSEHRAKVKKRSVRKFTVDSGQRTVREFTVDSGQQTVNKKITPQNQPKLSTFNYQLSTAIHGKVRESESENSGVESAHATDRVTEHAAGIAGQATSRQINKTIQKRRIKRDYATAFRQGDIESAKKTAEAVKKTAQKAKEAAQKAAAFAARHGKDIGIVIAVIAMFALLFSGLSSCGMMLQGGFQSVIVTSYTAEDTDITAVDESYTALEVGLRNRIDSIENEYPNYDEYKYNLDEIGHDPFELASYLTAKFNSYTLNEVQAELRRLFGQQYTLTITPVTEIRYRTETRTNSYTDADGNSHTNTYTVEVPYNWYVLNVTLVNRSLGSVALANLTADQAKMYRVYLETQGNKPDLFAGNVYVQGDYTDYDIPPEALTDAKFAAMIQEAEKYLGYPYVWGGSTPATSFDCSGFVCWVINHSGVGNVGRTTAQGLYNLCAHIPPSEAKPGDLVFFTGTYASAGPVSHVGIYVGNGMMIAAGNPIQYTNITTSYWTSHFYALSRLP